MKRLVLASAMLLAACAGHGKPDTAEIPVATSCVPVRLAEPDRYATPESLKGLKDGDWLKAVVDDWLARIQRMTQTEPVIENCRKPAPPT